MSMVDWAFERDADGLWRWMHVDARGVTRARRRVTVVGSADVLRAGIAERVQRASGLREGLWGAPAGLA